MPFILTDAQNAALAAFDVALNTVFGAGAGISISSWSRSGDTVTVNTAVAHGFNPNDTIGISPGDAAAFPGGFKKVLAGSGSSFTYTEKGAAGSGPAGNVAIRHAVAITNYADDATMTFKLPDGSTQPPDGTREQIRQAFRGAFLASLVGQRTWTPLTLINSWTSFDGGAVYNIPAFLIDGSGIVRLHGNASTGAVGSSMGVLPVGCRPLKTLSFPCVTFNGAINVIGEIQIDSAGNVTPQLPSANGRVSLDNISFPAEQ